MKKPKQVYSRLSNEDLLPLDDEKRTWKAVNFASIWMGCIHNIPTYATVGGLIAIGLSPWQVLAIIVTASLILFGALALNGHGGTKYGLPFPVIIRASYGIYGANIPALLRAFTAIMWLGIQTFAGSTARGSLFRNRTVHLLQRLQLPGVCRNFARRVYFLNRNVCARVQQPLRHFVVCGCAGVISELHGTHVCPSALYAGSERNGEGQSR